jgi:hypothetical protein
MNLRRAIKPLSLSALVFLALNSSESARGQYVVQPAPARFYSQQTQPHYPQRDTIVQTRQSSYYNQALPYNCTPYTDDWSTARHLPFPKPGMLPTRDTAAQGR